MANTETGWTTEWPAVNGIYWARWQSTVSVNTFIVEVIGKRFYMTGRSLICPNHETPAPYEWLGPLSPSDAEQLIELRKLLVAAAIPYEALLLDAESRRWIAPEVWEAMETAVINIRAALSPNHEKEKEPQ